MSAADNNAEVVRRGHAAFNAAASTRTAASRPVRETSRGRVPGRSAFSLTARNASLQDLNPRCSSGKLSPRTRCLAHALSSSCLSPAGRSAAPGVHRLPARGEPYGGLKSLGHNVARNTVKAILEKHGIAPAPERGTRTPWKTFLAAHWEGLAAADFSLSRS